MNIKYDNQELEWKECLTDIDKKKHSQNWLRKDTLDFWRHQRMLNPVKAFIHKGDRWLTIGDGRYGTEANFLLSNGVNALATDLSDKLLKVGNKIGFIKEYKKENAESLSFNDNEFDYVLIKEAFHHFPRPWLALYEAFRVAKKGVILIEPNDQLTYKYSKRKKLIIIIYNFFKTIKGLKTNKDSYSFEEVGNFIYTINNRELEKFLLGMHYRHIGTINLNDHYFRGIEYINLFDKKLINKIKILKLKSIVYLKEFLYRLGFINNSLNINILFKESPDKNLLERMKLYGWKYKKLPLNPYI